MELSLPTAVISAFIGSSVLLMAMIYVRTTPGAPEGLNWWIAGMALSCARYLTVYWVLATRLPAAVFVSESLQVISAIALAAGGVEFLGRRVSKLHVAAISAVAVAWAAYTTLVHPNFLLRAIPLYFTSGILLILVGVAFLRAQPTGHRSGYALTGILFMAWGLHKLNFPFLRPIQWFAPYGFLIAMILLMALAVSLIVIVQRRMLHVTENETRERQEAEAALSASERRFQRLFENSEVSLWNEDYSQVCEILAKIRQEGIEDLRAYLMENEQAMAELIGSVRVLNVNEATLKLFGAKNEADLVENIQSTRGPGARDVFIDELCAIWDGQKVFWSEAAFRSLRGKNFDAIISYQIPETEQGFSSIPVSIIDITDRKQAEATAQRKAGEELALGNLLRLSIGNSTLKDYLQDSIETLLNSVPWLNLLPSGGVFLAESDDDNKETLRLIAHHNFDVHLVDRCADIPVGKCHCGMAAQTRAVQYSSCVDSAHEITYEGIEQHGHYNVPILHNGAVLGVIVLYLPHDYPKDDHSVTFLKRVADVLSMGISARRTAQALGETEERFRTIVNNCPFAIFLKAPDGRYLFGNTEFLKWHALETPAIVVGKTSMEQFDAPAAAEMMEQDRVVLETRDVDVRQVVRKYRDDVTRHLLAIKFPILDDAGGIASIGCVDVDITRLKETENELKLAMEEAERANRAKSEFLASMSHELRTPLNAVLGFAQMLQFNAKHPLTLDQNRQVEHILEGGGHLLDLVNEILDLAKIEGDQLTLSLEEVDAVEIVADCMALAVPLGEQKHITIVNEFKDSDPVILRTDPLRLKQALLNLLSNAIKFNQDSGKVTMSGRILDDGFIHIAVTDTGVGIEEADKLNVFQMFHRLGADPTLTREGTGIGLTVTKHLVERLAGRIGFESEKGVGSTFWIDLPLAGNENVLIWTETMQIGIDAIDKDHKHLISLLNRLSHGPLEDVDTDNTIQELIEYTRYHSGVKR